MQLDLLTLDPAIAALKKGCVKSLLPLLQSYPDSFRIAVLANPKGNLVQHVELIGPGPGGTGTAVANSVGAEILLKELVQALSAYGGTATVSVLGSLASIKEKMKGVSAKLSKFLQQHTDVF